MSGHDYIDSEYDQELGPNPYQTWDEYFSIPEDDTDMINESTDVGVQNHNNTLPSVPAQVDPILDGTTFNTAGTVNDNFSQIQFADQPQFASPPFQNFTDEPMVNMPLDNANQAGYQSLQTSLPAQVFDSQPESNSDPDNYGFNPYNVPGLNNDPTWIPTTGADQQNLSQIYPATTIPGQYPLPSQQPILQRTLFQQGGQAMTGAGAIEPRNDFQPYFAGNHSFAPQPQGSLPNASSGLPHPAALSTPMAPKNVEAGTPMAQNSNDDAKPVSQSADPVKKETKSKKRAPKKPTTSNAKKTAVKFPLDNSKLLVQSLDKAKENAAIKQIKLKVVDDDFDDVAAQTEQFVTRISKALEVDYRPQAEEHERLTKVGRDEFTRWQTEHENKTWGYLADDDVKDPSEFAQSCATILYHKILEGHQSGSIADPGKAISNGSVDTTSKCSERINAAIIAIEQYSIVKYDFLRQDRLDALLASPKGFVGRKLENMVNNYKKKHKDRLFFNLEVDGKVSLAAPKTKIQGKRKRSEPSSPASDDEDEEQDEVDGDDDEEFEQPTKRTKRR